LSCQSIKKKIPNENWGSITAVLFKLSKSQGKCRLVVVCLYAFLKTFELLNAEENFKYWQDKIASFS